MEKELATGIWSSGAAESLCHAILLSAVWKPHTGLRLSSCRRQCTHKKSYSPVCHPGAPGQSQEGGRIADPTAHPLYPLYLAPQSLT